MKQTATEWLFEKLWETPKDKLTWNAILEQAKEMEKQQMKDATLDNVTTNKGLRKIFENQFEQYFSETYGYKEI
jgi:hypothetical protein